MTSKFLFSLLFPTLIITTCIAQPKRLGSLQFRDVYTVPNNLQFAETPVGGLSGIDFDATTNTYYLICDDRSALKPARYYKAEIKLSGAVIDTVIFKGKFDFIAPDGSTYPTLKADPKHTVDPEGLRLNPVTKEIVWVSEGERIVTAKDTVLVDPSITITQNGRFTGQFPLPENARVTDHDYGARQNGTLEALTFADGYNTLWAALEEPLYQDGPRADIEESRALVRFYRYDVASRKNTAQFAYDLEPVAHSPILPTAFRVNGITDILEAGNNQFLVVERSFSTGRLPCTVKIFLADIASATDVKDIASLKNNEKINVIQKRLLLDMDTLTTHVDNVEGITWGPLLKNGNRSLLLVTDNNFQSFQKTQIFLLEVLP